MLKIIVSTPSSVKDEFVRVNELLLDDGIDFFHLRKPDFDFNQMVDFLNEIDVSYHPKIVIHSNYSLIEKYDLAGIHLNKKALRDLAYDEEVDKCYIQPMVLRERQIEINRVRPNMVTYSAHSVAEINDLPFGTDYVFLSPIYDSISKDDYKSTFTDKLKLKEELETIKSKVIALGGVTENDKSELKQLGFKGYARLGDFWNK